MCIICTCVSLLIDFFLSSSKTRLIVKTIKGETRGKEPNRFPKGQQRWHTTDMELIVTSFCE